MDATPMASQIKEHMEIVDSNDEIFAVVDGIEGGAIKVTKGPHGQHHYIPMTWVSHVDTHVHLNVTDDQAMRRWTTEAPQEATS